MINFNLPSCFLFLSVCLLSCDLCRLQPSGRQNNLETAGCHYTHLSQFFFLSLSLQKETFSVNTLCTIYCLLCENLHKNSLCFYEKQKLIVLCWNIMQTCFYQTHYLCLTDRRRILPSFLFCSHSSSTLLLLLPSFSFLFVLCSSSRPPPFLFTGTTWFCCHDIERCESANEHHREARISVSAFNLLVVWPSRTQI